MIDFILTNWQVILPISISLISLGIVVFKEFFAKPKLETVLNSLVLLKIDEGEKANVLLDLILDDLLSGRLSDQANQICVSYPSILELIKTKNRNLVKENLIQYISLINSTGQILIYDPTESEIEKEFKKNKFHLNFYIPLNINNSGRSSGNVSNLILKITDCSNKKRQWAYFCFAEIKSTDLIKSTFNNPIGLSIERLFPGISLSPNENKRIDGFFIPMDTANNKIISRENLNSGKYEIQIIGYNSKGIKCLESNVSTLELTSKALIDCFKGTNIMRNLSLEDQIEKEFK